VSYPQASSRIKAVTVNPCGGPVNYLTDPVRACELIKSLCWIVTHSECTWLGIRCGQDLLATPRMSSEMVIHSRLILNHKISLKQCSLCKCGVRHDKEIEFPALGKRTQKISCQKSCPLYLSVWDLRMASWRTLYIVNSFPLLDFFLNK